MDQQTRAHAAGDLSSSTTPGRSIRLFLVDGTPQGVISAEIVNWTGKALSAPRARLADLLRRSEAARTGVYILTGPDPDRPAGAKVYIGEADNIGARLRTHLRAAEKDFFERLVIIVAKDDNLTKAHARFLESQLLRIAKESGAVALANDTRPDFQILPEADKADMDYFESQLRLVLPVLGFDIFRRPAASTQSSGDDAVFTLSTAGASATARETEDGFVVLAGSTTRRNGTDTFPLGYQVLRHQLVQDGGLVDGSEPELYRFATDVAFASPSAAASIVAARSASGPREWKARGSGLSCREWRAETLDEGRSAAKREAVAVPLLIPFQSLGAAGRMTFSDPGCLKTAESGRIFPLELGRIGWLVSSKASTAISFPFCPSASTTGWTRTIRSR